MDAYNIGKLIGVLCGFVLGIVLVVIIARICNRNRKMKTEYDERQMILRGRGYRWGFYAMLIYAALNVVLGATEIEVPAEPAVIAFSYIFVGAMVNCIYCIGHDAYWGLNNSKGRYLIIFAVITLINIAGVARAIATGSLIVDGRLSTTGINLMVTIMLVVIVAVLAVQACRERAAGKGDM